MKLVLDEKIVLSENLINKIVHGTLDSEAIAAKTSVANDLVEREIRFLKECQHENVVKFRSDMTHDSKHYMFMELAHGNLYQHLGLKEFTTARKRSMVEQISLGLEYIHSRNVVHRDIKATNILLIGPHRVVISDFAMAQRCDMLRHEPNNTVVRDGDYTKKSDIYQLGLLTFQIFADRKNIDRTWRKLGVEIEEAHSRGALHEEVFARRIWEETVVDSVNQQPGRRPTASRFHGAFTE